jgi:RHS repeat-associated protein
MGASERVTAGITAWWRAVAQLKAARATDVSPAIGWWTSRGTARATAQRRDVGHPLLLRTAWALVTLLALGLPSRADAQTAETPNFTIEYHHADLSGNIRLTTDEYGAVVREALHLPFGERDTGECGTLEDGARPLGYQGTPRDPKTCLDDFGARDYRAAIGRFQTVDPVLPVDRALRDPQQWNRYAYARNNPLIYTDPDGREIAVIHGGRLYGGGFSGQTVNTTTYGVVTPVHGLGAVAAGSTVVAAGRTFIAGVMSAGLTKLVPWLSGPQGQEAMTTAAEVLTGQELGPGGVPAGRAGNAKAIAQAAVDPNKLTHIFGKASHNLGPLVQALGSHEDAFSAVQNAAQTAVRNQGLSGVFETTVNVAGQDVVVRGNIIDGVVRIGTFFIVR